MTKLLFTRLSKNQKSANGEAESLVKHSGVDLFLAQNLKHLRAAMRADPRHRAPLAALARHRHLLGVFHGAFLAALDAVANVFIHNKASIAHLPAKRKCAGKMRIGE